MAGYDADELTTYRSLSALAVCALVMSVFALLALIGPGLIVLPVAGIILALLALRSIAVAGGALSGRSLAVAALLLSVLAATAAPTRFYVRDALYKRQADLTARRWLALLAEGNVSTAVELLTADAAVMLIRPLAPGQVAQQNTPEIVAAKLKEDSLALGLSSLSQNERQQIIAESITVEMHGNLPQVAIAYQAGHQKPLHASLMLQRRRMTGQGGVWQITSWSLLD